MSTTASFPTVIDSSIRASFVACPRQFFWRHIRSLGTALPSIDLHAGGSFARGLEAVRLAYWRDNRPFPEALHTGSVAAIEYWGDFEAPEEKEQKGLPAVLTALEYYFEQWPIETDPIQPYWWAEGQPAVEFTFAIPLPLINPETGEPVIYAGRCDLIGVYNKASLYTVDEKTTSQLGASWPKKFGLRGQFLGYAFAGRYVAELPVVGCITRGISFLKHNRHECAEAINTYPTWLVDRWYEQLLRDVDRMIQAWDEYQKIGLAAFDQNFSDACVEYSGCAFARLCQTNQPEDWIHGNYAIRHWNPLDKNPTGKPTQNVEVVPVQIPT